MPSVPLFQIADLHVSMSDRQILSGINLAVGAGEVHAIIAPTLCEGSTLAHALSGNPDYEITAGTVMLNGDDVTGWGPNIRAQQGMFLAFQNPQEIPGITVTSLIQQAVAAGRGEQQSVHETRMRIMAWMRRLDIDEALADRFLNHACSVGERKRTEMLQMAMLEPDFAVLDETSPGLHIDALEIVASGVQAVTNERPKMGVLAITHHQPLLDLLEPQVVHVLVHGKIVASGDRQLVSQLQSDGYKAFR